MTSEYAELITRFTTLDEQSCEAEAISLGKRGDVSLPALAQLLQAEEVDARFWAARALWANQSPQAVEMLVSALRDEEEMVRSGAALALGELKAGTAVDALARLLTTDSTASGDYAADALSRIGPPAEKALIEAMKNGQTWVRRRAAKALIPVESTKAIPVLFEALEDESYIVRHYAEEALRRMGVGQMVYFKV